MEVDIFGNEAVKSNKLRDKFLEPPFSVLDTRQGDWQKRKSHWAELGMKSEIGRDDSLLFGDGICIPDAEGNERKVSIFDPALTELMYTWFCPSNGRVLDPFAGGSVRGIVANHLGYKYTGLELREEQVLSNRDQAKKILDSDNQPTWIIGDSDKSLDLINDQYDFIFSCPPYFDLEIYSDKEDDLSNMTYDDFQEKYESIIKKSIQKLKKDSFACFVVGEIRDKKGFYRDFVGYTKQCFIKNGALLYNDAILLNSVGSAALRASKQFDCSKKLCKVHQNILIFKKI